MPANLGPDELQIQLRFGGGIHSRASEDEIDPRECTEGQNFDLDPQNRTFRNRKPFDLVGTTPNTSSINGFATLLKVDGTVSFLVQSGITVYEWDGASTFTSKGTVSASAKLRGRMDHNWQLDDKVLITDIALVEPVMEWDGTTLQDVTFTSNDGSTPWTGEFRAKYCYISNERAIFGNIFDNGTAFPHLIVGSETGDYTNISNDQRPSSALGEGDPFFLIQPDYRNINGMVSAYGKVVTSSTKGSLFDLTGTSAKDFIFTQLHPGSGADGDEAVIFVGNDIIYGRQGRIESVVATDKFGDTDIDDISNDIFDAIEDFDDWTLAYNSRNQRIYCIPSGQNQALVLHKTLLQSDISETTDAPRLSPWSKWTTTHATSFTPTAIMNMFDPVDGLEYVFFGDANGNVYRMEGTGSSGDAGTENIRTERLSKLFVIPADMEMFDIKGFIRYNKIALADVTLTFEYQGESVFDSAITITLPAPPARRVYGGGFYYKDQEYYGASFTKRMYRQTFTNSGRSNEVQVRVSVSGTTDVEIHEVNLRFQAAT